MQTYGLLSIQIKPNQPFNAFVCALDTHDKSYTPWSMITSELRLEIRETEINEDRDVKTYLPMFD